MRTVPAVESDAVGRDVTARPTRGHPQQVGVEEHVRAIAGANGQAFESGVLPGKIRADARALAWKILLEQAGPNFTFPALLWFVGGLLRRFFRRDEGGQKSQQTGQANHSV